MKLKNYAQLDRQLINLVLFVAVIAFGVGVLYQYNRIKALDLSQLDATVLSKPRDVAPFELTDNEGKPFNKKSLKGHWSLLFFGFTSCPQLCPTTMAELNKMVHQLTLDKLNKADLPQVYMVSIDPERDSQSKLNQYVTSFNPAFKGAYGDKQAVEVLTKQLGVVYMKAKNKTEKNYTINHTGTVMLFNPNGQLSAFFTVPHKALSMAKEYRLIEENS